MLAELRWHAGSLSVSSPVSGPRWGRPGNTSPENPQLLPWLRVWIFRVELVFDFLFRGGEVVDVEAGSVLLWVGILAVIGLIESLVWMSSRRRPYVDPAQRRADDPEQWPEYPPIDPHYGGGV